MKKKDQLVILEFHPDTSSDDMTKLTTRIKESGVCEKSLIIVVNRSVKVKILK